MGFDEADDHVHAPLLQGVGLFQHAVGLADPGGKTQIELQPAALAAVDQFQKILGSRSTGQEFEDLARSYSPSQRRPCCHPPHRRRIRTTFRPDHSIQRPLEREPAPEILPAGDRRQRLRSPLPRLNADPQIFRFRARLTSSTLTRGSPKMPSVAALDQPSITC